MKFEQGSSTSIIRTMARLLKNADKNVGFHTKIGHHWQELQYPILLLANELPVQVRCWSRKDVLFCWFERFVQCLLEQWVDDIPLCWPFRDELQNVEEDRMVLSFFLQKLAHGLKHWKPPHQSLATLWPPLVMCACSISYAKFIKMELLGKDWGEDIVDY